MCFNYSKVQLLLKQFDIGKGLILTFKSNFGKVRMANLYSALTYLTDQLLIEISLKNRKSAIIDALS